MRRSRPCCFTFIALLNVLSFAGVAGLQTAAGANTMVAPVDNRAPLPTANTDAGQSEASQRRELIKALEDRVAALKQELADLQAQLSQLKAAKPISPGSSAGREQKDAYEAALGRWQSRIDALQTKVAIVQNRLTQAQNELQKLKTQKPPAQLKR